MKRLRKPTLIEELGRMRVPPVFKGPDPWRHQLVCHFIGMTQPRFLFLLPMGSGKTACIIRLIEQVKRERKLKQALVVVPRLINMDGWQRDIGIFSDLEPSLCSMESIEGKRDTLLDPRGDVTLIDYQGLCLALTERKGGRAKGLKLHEKRIQQACKLYNFLDMDEVHRLANHQSLWFAMMLRLCQPMDFCYGNTGTLFGADPEEAWGQFRLIDGGETFGENLSLFHASFFKESEHDWKGTVRKPDRKMDRVFHRMLQHRSLEYTDDEINDLQPCRELRESFSMSQEQAEHYVRAKQGLIEARGVRHEVEAQWLRMRQITSGYLAWKDEYGDHTLDFKVNRKMELLERLADECCASSKIVVAYDYTATGERIVERLRDMGLQPVWLYGGTKDPIQVKRTFLDDNRCRAFVMNSASGGEGVDGLQHVSRFLIVYESPVEPKMRRQLLKRVYRPGQKHRSYVYDLVAHGTVDESILDNLAVGHDLYQALVNGQSVRHLRM